MKKKSDSPTEGQTPKDPGTTTLRSIIRADVSDLTPPVVIRIAELRFSPSELVPAHAAPARLLVAEQGRSVNGCLILGNHVFHGAGEIVLEHRVQTLRFCSELVADGRPAFLTLTLPWTTGRVAGFFAYARGRRRGGGRLKGVWFQERVTPFKDCGKLLSAQIIEVSDPGGAHKSKFEYYHFEKCDFIRWLDANGDPTGSYIRLTSDGPDGNEYKKGGVTIRPLSLPLASSPVGPTEKRTGQLRIFCVTGCTNSKVVQYVKSSLTFKPPDSDPKATMPKDAPRDWHVDGTDPYAGAVTNPEGETIVTDIPAAYESEVAAAANIKTLPKGATATYTWVLEIFFYCDGKLLAWVTWGGSVIFTMGDDGKLTPGAPSVDPPKLHGPDEFSQSAGNPKK